MSMLQQQHTSKAQHEKGTMQDTAKLGGCSCASPAAAALEGNSCKLTLPRPL
jgi:hypothetical protein